MTYTEILESIYLKGDIVSNRTGVDTKRLNFLRFDWDMNDGFPILQSKRVSFNNIKTELIWYLKGIANIKYLIENNCHVWSSDGLRYNLKLAEQRADSYFLNKFADLDVTKIKQQVLNGDNKGLLKFINRYEDLVSKFVQYGDLGYSYPIYWNRWAKSTHISQFKPDNRRMVMSAWNEQSSSDSALPPCHYGFQIIINNDNTFDLAWNQRSCDIMLGLPYNMANYGLLMKLIEATFWIKPRKLIGLLGDAHYYLPHEKALEETISKEYSLDTGNNVQILVNKKESLTDYTIRDIDIANYNTEHKLTHPTIMFGGIV